MYAPFKWGVENVIKGIFFSHSHIHSFHPAPVLARQTFAYKNVVIVIATHTHIETCEVTTTAAKGAWCFCECRFAHFWFLKFQQVRETVSYRLWAIVSTVKLHSTIS